MRQLFPRLQGHIAAAFDRGNDRRVIFFIDEHEGVAKILGGGAHQGRAADIDVFQHGIQVGGFFFQGLFERVEIDDDQVDLRGVEFLQLPQMVGRCLREYRSEDKRMQRFYPAVEDFREIRDPGNLGDRDAF